MGDHPTGHEVGEHLYVPGDTPIHRLPAHLKILAAVTTVLIIVATPGAAIWAFLGYAALVLAVVALARLPARLVATRMLVETPFVVFALLMPVLGADPQIEIGPFLLSQPGLWAAWAMLAKATLGVVVSITLAATTSTRSMVEALHRLHVPDLFVQIFGAMVRYVHVVSSEAARMKSARTARGFRAAGPRSWRVLAQSLGTLFVRSYERGERVHLAMLSRGYTGRHTAVEVPETQPAQWWIAGTLPVAAAISWVGARMWGS